MLVTSRLNTLFWSFPSLEYKGTFQFSASSARLRAGPFSPERPLGIWHGKNNYVLLTGFSEGAIYKNGRDDHRQRGRETGQTRNSGGPIEPMVEIAFNLLANEVCNPENAGTTPLGRAAHQIVRMIAPGLSHITYSGPIVPVALVMHGTMQRILMHGILHGILEE